MTDNEIIKANTDNDEYLCRKVKFYIEGARETEEKLKRVYDRCCNSKVSKYFSKEELFSFGEAMEFILRQTEMIDNQYRTIQASYKINKVFIDFIDRQKAEIDRLTKNLEEAHIDIKEHLSKIDSLEKFLDCQRKATESLDGTLFDLLAKARAEGRREFWERLRERRCNDKYPYVLIIEGDTLLKEMGG